MFKKEVVLILFAVFLISGAGCKNGIDITRLEKCNDDIECLDNFYFEEAQRLNDIGLCDNIYDARLKNECKGSDGSLEVGEVVSPFEDGNVALGSGDVPPKPN